jgi:hypothetical protein
MRDDDVRAAFEEWLRPVHEAVPPGLPMIKRRLRRRRSRNTVAGVLALGAAAGIAVGVQPVIAGPHPAAGPHQTPPASASTVPALNGPPTPIPGGLQSSTGYTIPTPVSSLFVHGLLGNVTVTGSLRSTVSVTEQLRYTTTPPTMNRTLNGDALSLGYTCPPEQMCAVSYDIQVPRGITVSVTSQNGRIKLASLAGVVLAQTSLGNITATGLTSPSANFTATNGLIDAAFASAPDNVYARTTLGTITILVPGTASYHTSLRTKMGTTSVTVPQSASSPHSISADATMGTITIAPAGGSAG